ncbi:MAG TPA: ABC transporter permease [Acidimicrobiales bacterium]|nr:ABC transporter permease [Acidimicrobiales bacterium]
MVLSPLARVVLKVITALALAFLYIPIFLIAILSLNKAGNLVWPPSGLTLHWWRLAWHNQGVRDALWTSVKVGLCATAIALILGTMASLAVHRFTFFGRTSISFLIVLPIALPGVVTGMALNRGFDSAGITLSFFTLIVAHATFCVVVVYNNVFARLRRLSPNLDEAGADLGADLFQSYRYITYPLIKSALLAGGLLAFALSFDEIVVTTFTAGVGIETLPQWIYNNIARPNQVPIVNVVAVFVILLSIIPVYLAQRLTDATAGIAGR